MIPCGRGKGFKGPYDHTLAPPASHLCHQKSTTLHSKGTAEVGNALGVLFESEEKVKSSWKEYIIPRAAERNLNDI